MVSVGGSTHYELSTEREGRVKLDGRYTDYATEEQAEQAAKKLAKERKTAFLGLFR